MTKWRRSDKIKGYKWSLGKMEGIPPAVKLFLPLVRLVTPPASIFKRPQPRDKSREFFSLFSDGTGLAVPILAVYEIPRVYEGLCCVSAAV